MKNGLLIFILTAFFSCAGKNDLPSDIIAPKKMQEVFWDYIMADVYATEFLKKDSNINVTIENIKLQEKIFKLHKTTREDFYRSYTWYSNHKELMTIMIDSMIKGKQREINKVKPVVLKPL